MLNIIDEFSRECLAIRINRKLKATDVIDALSDLFILRGIPTCQRRRDSAAFSRRKSAAGVEAIRPPISGALLYFSGHF